MTQSEFSSISWLTLRDLEYVVSVAQHGHFGQAAISCSVSQPGLSSQIKKIENLLGVVLFERDNRRFAITETGRLVAEQAQVILEEAQKLMSFGKPTQSLSGTLHLGAIATLGPYFIPHFLGPLRKQFSSLSLILREGLTDSLLTDLRNGKLDAVLAARTFKEDRLSVFPLFFEPFVLATPLNHPLGKKRPLRASDLNAKEMVLLEDGHCLRDQTLDTCPPIRRGHLKQLHATGLETLRHLVASGLGYTLMPELAVRNRTMNDLITYRKFSEKSIGREIVLVCRERYPGKSDIQKLAWFLIKNSPV